MLTRMVWPIPTGLGLTLMYGSVSNVRLGVTPAGSGPPVTSPGFPPCVDCALTCGMLTIKVTEAAIKRIIATVVILAVLFESFTFFFLL